MWLSEPALGVLRTPATRIPARTAVIRQHLSQLAVGVRHRRLVAAGASAVFVSNTGGTYRTVEMFVVHKPGVAGQLCQDGAGESWGGFG